MEKEEEEEEGEEHEEEDEERRRRRRRRRSSTTRRRRRRRMRGRRRGCSSSRRRRRRRRGGGGEGGGGGGAAAGGRVSFLAGRAGRVMALESFLDRELRFRKDSSTDNGVSGNGARRISAASRRPLESLPHFEHLREVFRRRPSRALPCRPTTSRRSSVPPEGLSWTPLDVLCILTISGRS